MQIKTCSCYAHNFVTQRNTYKPGLDFTIQRHNRVSRLGGGVLLGLLDCSWIKERSILPGSSKGYV